ncbi:type I polyketide synthase [Streptomyces sp. NRRL S-1868]|uniref:type I polyketide synthase n=1 Tax=Streptomyces sp. NRRL S-1868 TaxID=1463892 RepID=UPI0018FE902E|nr:type I polyketide synthase [Streptomyces sp. NRRL S-1868]
MAARARLMGALPPGGAMVAVEASEEEVRPHLSEGAALAAVNGPSSVVVSGVEAEVEAVRSRFEGEGRRTSRLSVSHAFHSPLMEPMLEDFHRAIERLSFQAPTVPVVSNVTGEMASAEELTTPGYWVRHVRETVRFADGIDALVSEGADTFVELGPGAALAAMVQHCVGEETGPDAVAVAALRKGQGEEAALLTALARVHTAGVEVDWAGFFSGLGGRRVELPTYPFQREWFWPEAAVTGAGEDEQQGLVDAEFWSAVERGDLAELSAGLGLDDAALASLVPALSSWRRERAESSAADAWRYQVSWKPLSAAPRSALSGKWLALLPAGRDADACAADAWAASVLAALGADAVSVGIDGADPDAMAGALAGALAGVGAEGDGEDGDETGDGGGFAGVVSLLAAVPGLPTGPARPDVLVRALAEAGIDAPLWCVTRGAVRTGRGDTEVSGEQAAVWGLGRVAALEQPERWGGLVDVAEPLDRRAADRFRAVLSGACTENGAYGKERSYGKAGSYGKAAGNAEAGGNAGDGGGAEDQVAVRASGVFGRRLARVTPGAGARAWRPTGAVLITGDLTGFGGHVARRFARDGADHVLFVGAQAPEAAEEARLRDELAAAGCVLTSATCPLSDREALSAALSALPGDLPLTAVVHTGENSGFGGPADGGAGSGAGETFLAALRDGVENLEAAVDAATGEGAPPEAFVLFASIAGTWGVSGQGEGAAAGAYLDAVALRRRARGLPALTVSWGAWEDATTGGLAAHLRVNGLPAMDPERALTALARSLGAGEESVTVADVAWDRFAPAFTRGRRSRLFDELPEARRAATDPAADGEGAATAGAGLRAELLPLPEADRKRALLALVRGRAAAVLGFPDADAVPEAQAFRDLGFDSLTAVDLRDQLATATGLKLPATVVFDHPTAEELAARLHTGLFGADGRDGADGGTRALPAPGPDGRSDADDPVVVVGMSCRYPGGVRSPEDLWDLVAGETDAIGGFPADRGWDLDRLLHGGPDGTGRSVTRRGGFLYDAAEFDPGFFGISPREAMVMDPQQRLVLETAWEALERTGIDPALLRGGDTGVFIGGGTGDYRPEAGQLGHAQTAQSASLLSGRLSYTFGLQGPSVSVDTACSSSLVALHLAAQALRGGECPLALAGGVTVMSSPVNFVEFGEMGALSPDGRCKAFADAADGTGWSEGVGVLVLERLSQARRNGHEVLAVLRGSAVNQDGASNGLTAPNGPAQRRVIRRALTAAGLEPGDVDAVEAHGTGTRLGDPIEAQALLETYGQDRDPRQPLLLGSVKANIGHTQAAAGVAGVIKMVLAMRHGVLPRTLHVDEPSRHVDWESGAVELLTEATAWPSAGRPRRAGVSAFGASGTNAHMIIEAPEPEPEPQPGRTEAVGAAPALVPVPVSAADPEALCAQADRLRAHLLAHPRLGPAELALALATARSTLEHRAALVAGGRDELLDELGALASGAADPRVVLGRTGGQGARTAFLFSGQGSQRPGMGRELYERFPVFAEALDAAVARLDAGTGESLWKVMSGDADGLDETGFTQPALFALEVALFRLVESWGVRPDFVAGHSVGEIAAAHVAGVFSLDDACRLVAARARLMDALPPGGAMVAVEASEAEAAAHLTEGVSVAAVNGPRAVVLSGDEDAVLAVAGTLAADGPKPRKTRRLRVSHAFHSLHMDAILDDFRQVARTVTYDAPALPLVSAVTGEPATGDGASGQTVCTPEHWVSHVRETVRFGDTVRTLAERGVSVLLELGPDGGLCALAQDTLDAMSSRAVTVPALRRDRAEERSLVTALARLHVAGAGPDWTALLGAGEEDAARARRTGLPTYPFRRHRFWPRTGPAAPAARALDADDGFWSAVQEEDLGTLEATLDVDGEALSKVLPALADWRRRRGEQATVDRWRQRVTWKPLDNGRTGTPEGTWLVVVPAAHADDPWVAQVLAAPGADTVRLDVTDTRRAALAQQLRELAAGGRHFTGVLSLLAHTGPHGAAAHEAPPANARTTALLQALGDAGTGAPLWCVTRGAVAVSPAEPVPGLDQAGVWGIGRVAALEHPDRWGGLIDLPAELDAGSLACFTALLARPGGEDQLAVRSATAYGRRLVPVATDGTVHEWHPTGTVLITGGTGALGAHVARGLAAAGARHLLLVGRRGAEAPGARQLRDELTALGAEVTLAACDAADRDALSAVLARIPAEAPLTGVVHAAGVLDDAVIDSLTPQRFEAVHRAKATSALVLHELTEHLGLEVFALFSSASAAVGNPGQANYAAANAVLDALAERRRAAGLAATSIAWGAWSGGGMADDDRAAAAARRTGVRPLDPALAVTALRQAVLGGRATEVLSDVEPGQFVRAFTAVRPSPLLAELAPADGHTDPAPGTPGHGDGPGTEPGAALRAELAGLVPAQREETVLGLVRSRAAAVLGHADADTVGPDRAFRDLGFDSLGAVELRNRMTAATGLELTSTLVFDHPTPLDLARHLLDRLLPDDATAPTAAPGGPGAPGDEPDDASLRALLASVPLDRLRQIGVLEPLLQLAADTTADTGDGTTGTGGDAESFAESIDAMDTDALVRAAMNGTSQDTSRTERDTRSEG